MDNALYHAASDRIEAAVDRWRGLLGMHGWRINRSFHDGQYVMPDGRVSIAPASSHVKWEYLYAHLDFNVEEMAGMDDARVEEIVVHELMHVMVNEMRDLCAEEHPILIKHEERVCETLAQAFIQVVARRGDE